jgi:plastocyanin
MKRNKKVLAGSNLLLAGLLFAAGCAGPKMKESSSLPATDTSLYKFNGSLPVSSAPKNEQAHGAHYATVTIKDMKFVPETITVEKGDTVEWVNSDITNHCVTEINKQWTSSAIASGASWKKVMTANADYYCAIHLVMKGKVAIK